MQKQQRKLINAALAAVTDVQIQVHSPQPAPTFGHTGEVKMLMSLSRRLQRYYVAAKLAEMRQQNRLLAFCKQLAQAMKTELQPVLDILFSEKEVKGSDGAEFADLLDSVRGKVSDAIMAIKTPSNEDDVFDNQLRSGYANELARALDHEMDKMGLNPRHLEFGTYQHEGAWGIFAIKCTCPSCKLRRMMSEDRPQEEIDGEIADLLKQHPGAVEVTSLDGVDLSDHSDDERAEVSEQFANTIAEGSRIFDLGHGNEPRFLSIETKTKGVETDLGGLGDLLGAPGSILGSILGGVGLMKPADVLQEVVDRKIAEVLKEHPGAVRIMSLDGIDLSDLTEEQRAIALEHLPKELEEGVILFDLGYGNMPRFLSMKVKGGKVSIDLSDLAGLAAIPGAIFGSGLDLAEMLAGAVPADRKPDSSDGKSKRPRGPLGWFSDLIRGQA